MNVLKCITTAFSLFACLGYSAQSNHTFIVSENGDSLSVIEGNIELPESRISKSQNTVTLTYQVLKTDAANPYPPVFLLAGGPGGSWLNTAHLSERFDEIQFYSRFSDVVIFDQRGTGRSVPNLSCKGIVKSDKAKSMFENDLKKCVIRLSEKCRDHWIKQGIDLSAYNTDESADDIDALRKWLGYDKIILLGGSYGSHLGLHYLRKYGGYVDRAIFYGIEGPDHTLDKPAQIMRTLERIAKEIEQSEYYAPLFSEKGLIEMYAEVIDRIKTGEEKSLDLLAAQFIFRYRAGRRNDLSDWPDNILDLYNENYEFADQVSKYMKQMKPPNAMSNTMDFASWASPERLDKLHNDTTTNLVGNINQSYFAKEGIWPVRDLGAAFRADIKSNVPVLLIHGTWDMSTPFENALEVAANLTNGQLLKVTNGSHGAYYELLEEWAPMKELLSAFVTNQEINLPDSVILELDFPDVFDDHQIVFWDAVIAGDQEAVQEALSHDVVLDLIDTRFNKNGRTALQWAAWHNHTNIVELLINKGADLNFQNNSGYTALHHAVENCSLDALQLLIQKGADAQIATNSNKTPISTAKSDCKKAIKWLQSPE